MRVSFENDYSEGCLPEIIESLQNTNYEQTHGYGLDDYSIKAKNKLESLLNVEPGQVDIHFTVGGTQSNLIIISHCLRSFAGVISAPEGHIATHESAAIEATGHKVLTIEADSHTGKLSASELSEYLINYWNNPEPEHTALPGMIYFSNATEFGTHYTASELTKIRDVADQFELPIFMDGARLGTALMAEPDQLTIDQLVNLVDVFTIGGTKNGALFGEAIVFTNRKYNLADNFRWTLKQRGGMLAKGRLLGLQFNTLFTNNLFFEAAKHANQMADLLRNGFTKRDVKFWTETKTNQVFVVINSEQKQKLVDDFGFLSWLQLDEKQMSEFDLEYSDKTYEVVRLVTSWATEKSQIAEFFAAWDKAAN